MYVGLCWNGGDVCFFYGYGYGCDFFYVYVYYVWWYIGVGGFVGLLVVVERFWWVVFLLGVLVMVLVLG